jgi:3-hydroxyacyl-[acyl-carrier-protein] dehydratase
MPPPVILDPATLDCSRVVADAEAIRRALPHRHEFALLDAVVHLDRASQIFAGYVDVRPDAWWARGHIPGRPLFPGVLMIEAAAQLSSYVWQQIVQGDRFLGLVGADNVKYRGTVEPPCRLIFVGRGRDVRTRRLICDTQGFVAGTMVFEGTLTGMPV